MPSDSPFLIQSRINGNDLKGQVGGLARLTPYCYIGTNHYEYTTLTGYANKPDLHHFRVDVSEIERSEGSETPEEHMLDIDSRNLYFGHNNLYPEESRVVVGEGASLEGGAVKGLPVKLQQVHFRAFTPYGDSDEYSAYFLVSTPVNGYYGFKASNTSNSSPRGPFTKSPYDLHGSESISHPFTENAWAEAGGSEGSSRNDFEERLVIGDPLRTTQYNFPFETRSSSSDGVFPFADSDPSVLKSKPNTWEIKFDTGTLVTAQSKADDAEAAVAGNKYRSPYEIILAGRNKIHARDAHCFIQAELLEGPDFVKKPVDNGDTYLDDRYPVMLFPAVSGEHVVSEQYPKYVGDDAEDKDKIIVWPRGMSCPLWVDQSQGGGSDFFPAIFYKESASDTLSDYWSWYEAVPDTRATNGFSKSASEGREGTKANTFELNGHSKVQANMVVWMRDNGDDTYYYGAAIPAMDQYHVITSIGGDNQPQANTVRAI